MIPDIDELLHRYEDSSTIRVIVGSRKAVFQVHKSFVCKVSPFFHGACNSLFQEAMNDEVYLPDADPKAFNAFMDWVYTHAIKLPKRFLDKANHARSQTTWSWVAKMYLLASYLQCTSFGNALVDAVSYEVASQLITSQPQSDIIEYVYTSTIGDCGLRRLLVAVNVWKSSPVFWKRETEWRRSFSVLTPEFSTDLIVSLQRKNHKMDHDPFSSDRRRQAFRDTEIGSLAVKTISNNEN